MWFAIPMLAIVVGHFIWSATVVHDGPGPSFAEIHEQAGISFLHFNGSPRSSLLPEDVGSGIGWADYDSDGDEDLYLVNFAGPFLADSSQLQDRPGNRLYRNEGDGQFTDVTASAGVGHVGHDYACLWFDYDNDARIDLAITHYDGITLYRNQGNGTFRDVTASAGLDGIHRFLLGMTAGDIDRDGDLDLYLCGYVTFSRDRARHRPIVAGRPAVWTNPVSYTAEPNILLRNEGDGTFVDITDAAGVANRTGKSMQALFCDFDNDGWPDLFVGNDVATPDALFHNLGDGTFADVTLDSGLFDPRATMGIAVGDLWHRGSMDAVTTHWVAEDHALWKNRSVDFRDREIPIAFDDMGPAVGLVACKPSPYVGWGVAFRDFDNDGQLDIMIANGSTIEDELTLDVLVEPKLIPQRSQLLWNNRQQQFVDLGPAAGEFFGKELVCRGLAVCDFDQDGGLDAAVITLGGPVALLRNTTASRGHWLQVRLRGTNSNRFGIGARVSLQSGPLVQHAQVVSGSSYLSSDTLTCHFGLGPRKTVDSLQVTWPSGQVTQRSQLSADQIITITEGD